MCEYNMIQHLLIYFHAYIIYMMIIIFYEKRKKFFTKKIRKIKKNRKI